MSGIADRGRTAVRRLAEARRNEDLVLAESSLEGERRVTVVRVVMVLLFGLSQEAATRILGAMADLDRARIVAVTAYGAFAVAMIFNLRRRRPSRRGALWGPLLSTAVDYTFLTFMAARGFTLDGQIWPEMGAIAFALVQCFSVSRFSWVHVAVSTAMACTGYLGLALATGTFSAITTPFVLGGFMALGMLLALTNRATRRLFTALRRHDNLTRFLPRQVAERLVSQGEQALAPVLREVTVLFSDIRDFTTFSERLPPRAVLEFLDEYFGHMAQIVKGRDGMVNKFLGDGMLAVWGVPDPNPAHAELALRAALDMRTRMAELNDARQRAGELPIHIGIGVHSGTVAAGMLGGADQHEYTVIGDAVNLASRIESLTKTLQVDVLVSESTWRLVEGRFGGQRLARETVKGRTEPVTVYSLAPR